MVAIYYLYVDILHGIISLSVALDWGFNTLYSSNIQPSFNIMGMILMNKHDNPNMHYLNLTRKMIDTPHK